MIKLRRCPECKQISPAKAWQRARHSYRPWTNGYRVICPVCGHQECTKKLGEVVIVMGESPDPKRKFRRCPGCAEVLPAGELESFKSQYGNYYLRRCPLCGRHGRTGEFSEVVYDDDVAA